MCNNGFSKQRAPKTTDYYDGYADGLRAAKNSSVPRTESVVLAKDVRIGDLWDGCIITSIEPLNHYALTFHHKDGEWSRLKDSPCRVERSIACKTESEGR